jgi:protein O-mannosyl-transferase
MNDWPPDAPQLEAVNPYESPAVPHGDPHSTDDAAQPGDVSPRGSRAAAAAVCGLLCLATFAVFCQTTGYDFVNYDDDSYVYDNGHIKGGLSWDGLKFYAIHYHAYTYHPVSTYSHMFDCQVFGVDKPGGHHATNFLLHGVSASLLFLLLRRMTGRIWPSALVAALFAVHPLHVQSVAWVSERKDVLSGLFFFLTIGGYLRYVRAPSIRRYTVVFLLFALGLLAKPMLVTLPFVLLLLDYWPLRRWQAASSNGRRTGWGLIYEKIPLFLLAIGDSALTIHTQVNAIQPLDYISGRSRIANAATSYVNYLGSFFWPRGLAILYPHPRENFDRFVANRAAVILAVISAGVLLCTFIFRRRAPYLLVGWLWYLGMLVPVIGLLQVGGQSMADRYTYLPLIGPMFALVWAASDAADFLFARCSSVIERAGRLVVALAAAGIIAAFAACAWQQASYWRNSETLWNRDIDMKYANSVAYYNLGLALAAEGLHDKAIAQYENACAITPDDEETLVSFGQSLEAVGRIDEAVKKYRAVQAQHKYELISGCRLAAILLKQGKDRESLLLWRHLLIENPTNVEVRVQVAWLLAASSDASLRNGKLAVEIAQKLAASGDGTDPARFDLLAAADAEAGDSAAAVENAKTALEIASARDDDKLAGEARERLALYQAGKPYHRQGTGGK